MAKKFCVKCGRRIIKGARNQTLCDVCLLKLYKRSVKNAVKRSESRSERFLGQE